MAGQNGWTPSDCSHADKPHVTKQSCYFRSWYEANRRGVIDRVSTWKADNRGKHLAGKRKWSVRHRDVVREAKRRRRVRVVGGEVVPYRERDIYERDRWLCHVCREPIDPKLTDRSSRSPTLDHIIAVSQGGADSAENVRAAHKGCNTSRYWRELTA